MKTGVIIIFYSLFGANATRIEDGRGECVSNIGEEEEEESADVRKTICAVLLNCIVCTLHMRLPILS